MKLNEKKQKKVKTNKAPVNNKKSIQEDLPKDKEPNPIFQSEFPRPKITNGEAAIY